MTKKKYVKPEMVAEAFVSNVCVQPCGITQGDTLTAKCAGEDVTMKITSSPGGEGEMTVSAIDGGSTDVGNGTIYPDLNEGSYLFVGSIFKGHNSSFYTGEYIGKESASAEGKGVGERVSGGQIVCNHELASNTFHHHLTNVIINVNLS